MIEAFTVRRAVPEDAEGIARVHVSSWQAAYAGLMPASYLQAISIQDETERWRRGLPRDEARGRATFLAEDAARRPIGHATVGPDLEDPSSGLLFLMYVLADWWGRGVGHALMQASEQALAAMGFRHAVLWVLEANARARRFYERAGWLPDGASHFDDYGGTSLFALRYARDLSRAREA